MARTAGPPRWRGRTRLPGVLLAIGLIVPVVAAVAADVGLHDPTQRLTLIIPVVIAGLGLALVSNSLATTRGSLLFLVVLFSVYTYYSHIVGLEPPQTGWP